MTRAYEHFHDPVAAYDHLAPEFPAFCKRRELYLRAVERQIVIRIPGDAQSLLDIGAADGTRAMRIAAGAKIARVVLVEPSPGMLSAAPNATELWRMKGENLDPEVINERFDVITCLWNVLGHVLSAGRLRVLKAAAQLLSAHGKIFVDVNHRYNARSYGLLATCARWTKDTMNRTSQTGDVTVAWNLGTKNISTYGHVFRHREIMRLADTAGLELEQRIIVDYQDGSLHRLSWCGNLLYVFRRSS
jgi:2-polyprenyl-3-methyl-5-hydroxy-6-metoxy-1,4-benzoquinol methylase